MENLSAWQIGWRDGVSKVLDLEQLERIKKALDNDDKTLIQTETVIPEYDRYDKPNPRKTRGACLIGFCGWKVNNCLHNDEVHEFFGQKYQEAMAKTSKSNAFITWFDGTPREKMIPLLLEEVNRSIKERTV